MKNTYRLLFPAIAALMLSSCVKDDLYDTPHPSTGAVTVTADWSAISSTAFIPETYNIVIDDFMQTVSGATNSLERTFTPGQYEILLHNTPEGITVDGDIATVNTSLRAGDEIEPMPDYLFSGFRSDLVVNPDASTAITVGMNQHVRRLNIELSVVEGDHTRIASASASLCGVESQMNYRTGERASAPANVSGIYSRLNETLSLSYNLLGVVHESHPRLVTTLTFTDGHVQTIESDLSGDLREFHDDTEPLTLRATLSVPVQSGMSATITGWHKADGGNVDAH